MGTNFYKVQKLSREVKNQLIDSIENNRIEKTEYNTYFYDANHEEIEIPKTRIHIGKRSAGWKFLFDGNDWIYYPKDKQKFIEWLKDPNSGEIQDEYGEKFSFEEFWKQAMDTYTTPWIDGHERYDAHTYHLAHPDEPYFGHYEFYIDDLRFSTSTNFS